MHAHHLPDCLCHYYESSYGTFRSLSVLPEDEAERLMSQIREEGTSFASRRSDVYPSIRCGLEQQVRALFIENGDTFPAMRYQDGRPYRGQVYLLAELDFPITSYGLPQMWNSDGENGPERYIEVQVRDAMPLLAYLSRCNQTGCISSGSSLAGALTRRETT